MKRLVVFQFIVSPLLLLPTVALTSLPEFINSQINVHYDLRSTRTNHAEIGDVTISDQTADGWLFNGANGPTGVPHILFRRSNQFSIGSHQRTNAHLFWISEFFGAWWPWGRHADTDWIGTIRVFGKVRYRVPSDCHFIQVVGISCHPGSVTATIHRAGSDIPLTYISNHSIYVDECHIHKKQAEVREYAFVVPDLPNIHTTPGSFPTFLDLEFRPFIGVFPNSSSEFPVTYTLSRRSIIPVRKGDIVDLQLDFTFDRKIPEESRKGDASQRESFGAISIREIGNQLADQELSSSWYASQTRRIFGNIDDIQDLGKQTEDMLLYTFQYSRDALPRILTFLYLIDYYTHRISSNPIGEKNDDASMKLRNILMSQIDRRDSEYAQLMAFRFLGHFDAPTPSEDIKHYYDQFLEAHAWLQDTISGTDDTTYLAEIDSHLLRLLVKTQNDHVKPRLQAELTILERDLVFYEQIATLLHTLEITLTVVDVQGTQRILKGIQHVLSSAAESSPEIQEKLDPLVKIIDHYTQTQPEVPLNIDTIHQQSTVVEEVIEKHTIRCSYLRSWIEDLEMWGQLNDR